MDCPELRVNGKIEKLQVRDEKGEGWAWMREDRMVEIKVDEKGGRLKLEGEFEMRRVNSEMKEREKNRVLEELKKAKEHSKRLEKYLLRVESEMEMQKGEMEMQKSEWKESVRVEREKSERLKSECVNLENSVVQLESENEMLLERVRNSVHLEGEEKRREIDDLSKELQELKCVLADYSKIQEKNERLGVQLEKEREKRRVEEKKSENMEKVLEEVTEKLEGYLNPRGRREMELPNEATIDREVLSKLFVTLMLPETNQSTKNDIVHIIAKMLQIGESECRRIGMNTSHPSSIVDRIKRLIVPQVDGQSKSEEPCPSLGLSDIWLQLLLEESKQTNTPNNESSA